MLFDSRIGFQTFDVTSSVQAWALGEANFGWLFESGSTNGWDFDSSEGASSTAPQLSVDFDPPAADQAGEFRLLELEPVITEGNSGTSTIDIPVTRSGGLTGTANVEYTVTAGTADSDDFVEDSGTVVFTGNETIQTITVTVNGDVELEGFETVIVTLTNSDIGTITTGFDVATLTIADDDALINEVLANISTVEGNTTDETDREYVELIGTPDASLDGYYFAVLEGEEEEGGGNGVAVGLADFVVD